MTDSPTEISADVPGSALERQFNLMMRHREPDPNPCHRYKAMLRRVGLRPTDQRMALANMLFSQGNRHVTAEMLFDEAIAARIPLSLATVYNVLRQFTEAGLLRQIGVDCAKTYFDTNPSEHHHFFIQDEDALLDIPAAEAVVARLPQAPEGFEVERVTVIVRLRRKRD